MGDQGMLTWSASNACVDFDESKDSCGPGMAYVAMPRCRKIEDLLVTEKEPWSKIRPNWQAEKALSKCRQESEEGWRAFLSDVRENLITSIPSIRREEARSYIANALSKSFQEDDRLTEECDMDYQLFFE